MFLITKRSKKKVFKEWVERHNSALYKHALWMTGNRDTAMDMVQECFFQAWLAIDSLKDKEKSLPWLLTILRRAIYKEQRYQYRQAEMLEQFALMDEKNHQQDGYQLSEIYNMLEGLSSAHRDIFLMHHLHGFSYQEISEQLEIPMGTVMSRISRAKKDLGKLKILSENNITFIKKNAKVNV
ncbi:MAG: sigma-70 family RNA polymerase sigma factor [Gammaproteobacteria bacterium]|nr:sigma-70 family RNA polymerase sigma factor [Gammaproteobacteria bacterium]